MNLSYALTKSSFNNGEIAERSFNKFNPELHFVIWNKIALKEVGSLDLDIGGFL